jgi:hypothetical protein
LHLIKRFTSQINKIAKQNWDLFNGEEVVELPSHLLLYPIRVDPQVITNEMPNEESAEIEADITQEEIIKDANTHNGIRGATSPTMEIIPDSSGKFSGGKSLVVVDKLTT